MKIYDWPNKQEREEYSIHSFIDRYKNHLGIELAIVEDEREKPDFVCEDKKNGLKYGVEVTSVYSSDKSVRDQHKPLNEGKLGKIDVILHPEKYFERVIKCINVKREKAQNYDQTNPLILSIYLGEYAFISSEDLQKFYDDNVEFLSDISPYHEIMIMTDTRCCLI